MVKTFAPPALLLCLTLLGLLAACSKPPPTTPTLPVGLNPGWNRVAPAGETVCADGSEYAFYVQPGTVNKLLIDFEGGGACWNGPLCANPSTPQNNFGGVYVNRVYGSPADYNFGGVYDREDPANPFRDWYQVHVSYCTGDLHLGDNEASYPAAEGEVTVRHRGAVNTRAVLEWTFRNFSAPETVVVAGVSAGAYASVIWLPEVATKYPDADVAGLGDSGAGVVTPGFFAADAANWRINEALPELGAPVALDENILPNLYRGVGQKYPDVTLAQYTSVLDGTQIGFYGLMQGITEPTPALAADWSAKMTASLGAVAAGTPNFRFYVSALDIDNDPANGTAHVILQRPEFYTLETRGVRFVNWLGDLANGQALENVTPDAPPASALGDSPTVEGRIVNLAGSELEGQALELKAGTFSAGPVDDVFGSSPVAEGGSFSLRLLGAAEMTPRLLDAVPEVFTLPGCDVTLTPAAFKFSAVQDFALFTGDESADTADEVIQSRIGDPGSALVDYYYVDRDVSVTGTCADGDYAGFVTATELRRGWNTVVADFAALEVRNEDPGAGYEWRVPSLEPPPEPPPPDPEAPRAP